MGLLRAALLLAAGGRGRQGGDSEQRPRGGGRERRSFEGGGCGRKSGGPACREQRCCCCWPREAGEEAGAGRVELDSARSRARRSPVGGRAGAATGGDGPAAAASGGQRRGSWPQAGIMEAGKAGWLLWAGVARSGGAPEGRRVRQACGGQRCCCSRPHEAGEEAGAGRVALTSARTGPQRGGAPEGAATTSRTALAIFPPPPKPRVPAPATPSQRPFPHRRQGGGGGGGGRARRRRRARKRHSRAGRTVGAQLRWCRRRRGCGQLAGAVGEGSELGGPRLCNRLSTASATSSHWLSGERQQRRRRVSPAAAACQRVSPWRHQSSAAPMPIISRCEENCSSQKWCI